MEFAAFVKTFREIQDGMVRDYQPEDGRGVELCEVMHREIGLDQTPAPDAEERAALINKQAQMQGRDLHLEADSIKLTSEHLSLHHMLGQIQVEARMGGLSSDELLATLFAIGRRYGMREAAEALGSSDDFAL